MWHTMSANEVAEKLKVDVKKGLTEEELQNFINILERMSKNLED